MSNYGPPGRPYPRRSTEPPARPPGRIYPGRPRTEQPPIPTAYQAFGRPAPPPAGSDHPSQRLLESDHPTVVIDRIAPDMEPDAEWTPLESTPPKQGRRALVVASVALAVVLLGGAATAYYYLFDRDTSTPTAGPPAAPGGDPSGSTGSTPTGQAGTSEPESRSDVRSVAEGDCVRNDGDNGRPELVLTGCGPKSYQVLARIDGKVTGTSDAEKKCGKVKGYTNWYYYDSPRNDLDFVLCLKRG